MFNIDEIIDGMIQGILGLIITAFLIGAGIVYVGTNLLSEENECVEYSPKTGECVSYESQKRYLQQI